MGHECRGHVRGRYRVYSTVHPIGRMPSSRSSAVVNHVLTPHAHVPSPQVGPTRGAVGGRADDTAQTSTSPVRGPGGRGRGASRDGANGRRVAGGVRKAGADAGSGLVGGPAVRGRGPMLGLRRVGEGDA